MSVITSDRSGGRSAEQPPSAGAPEPPLPDRSVMARARALPELAIGVCLMAMYLPAIISRYGMKDDFTLMASAHGYAYAGPTEPAESARVGRPLYGVLAAAMNSVLPDVNSLWIARALAMIGLVVFAVVLYRVLISLTRSRLTAAAVALLICSLPPFLVYVGWATLFPIPYAATLGEIAALFAVRAADGGRRRVRWIVAGNVALLLALVIYQPAAMTFWLVALIIALSMRHSPALLPRLLRCVALVGAPAMIGAYLILKIGVWTLGSVAAQREGLFTDPLTKLLWVPKPVGLALNLFYMPQSAAVAAVGACLVVAGVLLFARDCAGRARAAVLALVAIAVPLSFAPSLLSNEDYSTFRTSGALTATLALLVALIFISVERDSGKVWQQLAARGGLCSLAAVSVVLGFSHLRTLITLPLSREWRLVSSQTARLPPNVGVVAFLAPTFDEGPITTSYGVRDEFGVPTSASTWADSSLVWLAARQAGLVTSTRLKVLVSVGAHAKPPPGIPYIDMRKLKRLD
jgi:hypothetical protein